jgi:regulator of sigma E protease
MVADIIRWISFLIGLSFIIFFHEVGHYLACRLFKIEVEEFGFGYPPRARKLFTRWGTIFSLNWIPFGGFNKIKGENDPDVPGGFYSASPWKRLIVLLAGSGMNLLVAFLIMTVIFTNTGAPNLNQVQLYAVQVNAPAEQAGLRVGDVISKINDTQITSIEQMRAFVQTRVGESITLSILRDGENMTFTLIPRKDPPQGEGPMGVILSNPITPINSIFEAIPYASQHLFNQIQQLILLPGKLIRGELTAAEARPVSIIGMGSIYAEIVTPDSSTPMELGTLFLNIFSFWAVISMALGMTNLLPIPALDGGRILFLLPELLFRKRIPAKYENAVNSAVFVLLLGLMAFLMFMDVIFPVQLPK